MTEKILLTVGDLEAMGIGKRTKIFYLTKYEDFPKPLNYDRTKRWMKKDVIGWLDRKNPNNTQGEEND
ncbi:hypothetical protein [Rodentibacter pneumotropicus]|uniref:hypothetical protein n=1 Tax=Rodentibacter pneumotropicus TaxID=758 RepID=UPI00037E98F4|nr:hypothetical protein [Rodentibacter pneumotropicus]